jgi:hypothetical protein
LGFSITFDWEIRRREPIGCVDVARVLQNALKAHDVPGQANVADFLLPDDDEASGGYN